MFNYEKVKNLTIDLGCAQAYGNQLRDENLALEKVISRAVRVFVPQTNSYTEKFTAQILRKSDATLLTEFMDKLDYEKAEQIQDDILREKVEKIVLALREHKWEPA